MGEQGSGAIFFAYCPLQCVYCQNRALVQGAGVEVSPQRLAEICLELQNNQHAANINLVTPTHYVPTLAEVIRPLRETGALHIPVVYNTSSYDEVSTLGLMDGIVDIYLADYKYAVDTTAQQLSRASHYSHKALLALDEMFRQVPEWIENDQGLLKRGVIVRHLVLPGRIEESLRALDVLHDKYGNKIRLSIMSQYTPLASVNPSAFVTQEAPVAQETFVAQGANRSAAPLSHAASSPGASLDKVACGKLGEWEPHQSVCDLARYGLQGTVSPEEYEQVLDYADSLGFEDYFWQEGETATESFIPAFDGTGC